jgi:opacity protein-like surface antigen
MKKMMVCAVMAVAIVLIATSAMAGQVRLAGYYDVSREQRTITVDGFSQLSTKWSTWGFVDFYTNQGNQKEVADNADPKTYFGKGTVSYRVWQIDQENSIQFTAELIDSSGSSAIVRPGMKWMIAGQQGWLSIKALPVTIQLVEPENEIPQTGAVGMAGRLNLNDKFFLEGFCEMTFAYEDQTRHYPLISETQLGYRLTDRVNILMEYRYNNFADDNHGLGLGAEIVF